VFRAKHAVGAAGTAKRCQPCLAVDILLVSLLLFILAPHSVHNINPRVMMEDHRAAHAVGMSHRSLANRRACLLDSAPGACLARCLPLEPVLIRRAGPLLLPLPPLLPLLPLLPLPSSSFLPSCFSFIFVRWINRRLHKVNLTSGCGSRELQWSI